MSVKLRNILKPNITVSKIKEYAKHDGETFVNDEHANVSMLVRPEGKCVFSKAKNKT